MKGATWVDGCQYKCECFDMNGNYGCEDRWGLVCVSVHVYSFNVMLTCGLYMYFR